MVSLTTSKRQEILTYFARFYAATNSEKLSVTKNVDEPTI
jgi:hypothetical protein